MKNFFDRASNCPICTSKDLVFYLKMYYWRENLLTYDRCNHCGAIFANPMPSDQLISSGNNALVKWFQQGTTFDHEFRHARQAYLKGKMFSQELKRWKEKGTFLELGCHHGFFSLGLQDHSDWEVEGLEISDSLSAFVNQKLGIVCHNGTLEELQLPQEKYDFILCHDLIEHINQPNKFIQEIVRILKPGGRIQIITPNSLQDLAFAKRTFDAGKPLSMILNHIMYFSPKTLRQAMEGVGLKVDRMYCYDVRHSAKDFGWFGLGKPIVIPEGPSMTQTLGLPGKDLLSYWTPSKIEDLRSHKKVSWLYGWFKERLPQFFTLRVPAQWGIGHEIYALVEKPRKGSVISLFLVLLFMSACATTPYRPCTQGGQPVREGSNLFQGTKKCYQSKDSAGNYVNDGKYYEWYTSDKIAVEGEYKMGKKTGRWIEYDEKGNKTSDRYFEDGKEIPRP